MRVNRGWLQDKPGPPRKRWAERFIGACGGSVAAASPEMRFEWRISEPSAERSVHWPLTLMNSARCAASAEGQEARAGNAGRGPTKRFSGRFPEPRQPALLADAAVCGEETFPQGPSGSIPLAS